MFNIDHIGHNKRQSFVYLIGGKLPDENIFCLRHFNKIDIDIAFIVFSAEQVNDKGLSDLPCTLDKQAGMIISVFPI